MWIFKAEDESFSPITLARRGLPPPSAKPGDSVLQWVSSRDESFSHAITYGLGVRGNLMTMPNAATKAVVCLAPQHHLLLNIHTTICNILYFKIVFQRRPAATLHMLVLYPPVTADKVITCLSRASSAKCCAPSRPSHPSRKQSLVRPEPQRWFRCSVKILPVCALHSWLSVSLVPTGCSATLPWYTRM